MNIMIRISFLFCRYSCIFIFKLVFNFLNFFLVVEENIRKNIVLGKKSLIIIVIIYKKVLGY